MRVSVLVEAARTAGEWTVIRKARRKVILEPWALA